MATASGILARGNVWRTRASDAGTMAAAKTAWATRKRMRNPTPGATPHSIEAIVKPTTAVRKVRRRPMRSARRPAGIRVAANVIV